jgi:hypothetical protein
MRPQCVGMHMELVPRGQGATNVIAGVLVWGAIAYAAVFWVRREGLRFYDLYVAKYGGHPSRQALDAERAQNPFSIYLRPLRGDRFRMAQVYTPVADQVVERARQRTKVAVNATWAVLILSLPIVDIVYSLSSGHPLPQGWLFSTIGRTVSLVVLVSAWIQWLVAPAKGSSGRWWRAIALGGMAIAAVGFFLFSLI